MLDIKNKLSNFGFIKKSQKTPARELALAKRRLHILRS